MTIELRAQTLTKPVCTCCVCGNIRENGIWMEDDENQAERRSHTYCPTCLASEVQRNFPDHCKTVLAQCLAAS